jgi:predicted outer membrane lipoprotein
MAWVLGILVASALAVVAVMALAYWLSGHHP